MFTSEFFCAIGPPSLAGRLLWIRVCLTFRPSILSSFHPSGRFLGIVLLVFSKFGHDARNPCEVVPERTGFTRKCFFAPEIGKMGQKQGFLNILKNFVINFYWISTIMKIYIAVFLHKSYTWENSGSWDMGQNVLSQSDCRVFKPTIFG